MYHKNCQTVVQPKLAEIMQSFRMVTVARVTDIKCLCRTVFNHSIFHIIWSAVGIAVGISSALLLVAPPVNPFLLASLGGSAIFLFGLTTSQAAQPRALFFGHLSSAFIGIICYKFFGDAIWVYALAQSLAFISMKLTGTIHPPAGANPLIMIYSHAGFSALFQPVLAGITCMAAIAALWSRLFPGHVHYPTSWLGRSEYRPLGVLNDISFDPNCLKEVEQGKAREI